MKIREPEVIYKGGKPTSVILPISDYEKMLLQTGNKAGLKELKGIRSRRVRPILF